jgi:ribulose-5-phosphate 4-epimerase/fuculose-1-phosphate aldolase
MGCYRMSTDEAARSALIEAARAVAARGLTHGSTGNVSVRVDDRIIVTPTRSSLATVTADELAVIDLDGAAHAGSQPSKEAFLHAAVYEQRPEARAIVHTHSLHATAISCLADLDPADALPPLTAYYAMRVEALPLVGYCAPGDRRLATLAGEVARSHAAMLLRNHGPLVAAGDAMSAVDCIEEIEQMSQITLLLQGSATLPLSSEERARLHARTSNERRSHP